MLLRRSTTAAFRGRSLLLLRCSGALNYYYYSKASSRFSEILRDSLHRASAYDHFFIKRKVQVLDLEEDEEDMVGSGASRTYSEPDIGLRSLVWQCAHPEDYMDPAATIASFALEVCSNQTLTYVARGQALRIILGIARHRADSLEKHRLVNPILQAMLPLLLVLEEVDLSSTAKLVVKEMAVNHPEQVFPSVLEFASSSSQNTDRKHQGAAVTILGYIAEGCPELMKDRLEHVLGIVLGAHRDPDQGVRSAASRALHRFVKHLRPEILSHSQTVLPCILSALERENLLIELRNRASSYYSLEALCDNMTGEEMLPFLDPIINTLLAGLQERDTCRPLLSFKAMCSVAAVADQHFVPYAERVLEVLTRIGTPFPGPENLVFAGLLVATVGRAGAEPMIAPYIGAAVSATADSWNNKNLDWECRERRYTYGFFCTVAETLCDGFAKYLPDVVPLAIHSCNLDEEDDDDPHTRPFRMTSLLDEKLDEKAAAARALGLFAVHTKSAFAPYLEESMSALINISAHHHEDVRLQGVIGLKNILTAAAAVSESPTSDGAAKAKQLLGTVMDHHIKAMDEDGDKRVVAQVCTNTAGILEDFGYTALETYVPQIIDSASRLLQGQSPCQRADDSEHEETLMAAASNLLSAVAKAAAATSRFAKAAAAEF